MSVFVRRVSWVDDGQRVFGQFVRWDGDFAICMKGTRRTRIHKGNLTFEGQ